MSNWRSALLVAAISLLSTWLFFVEYIPPAKSVHLKSDIEGYHYPLLNYALKSLRDGRLPLWDPSIYCGVPFAANIQAGLFYPPNWFLYLTNGGLPWHKHGLRFLSVEMLAFAHVWLTLLFTFLWLRERTASWLPAAIGSTVAAFSGYLVSQMNHLGVCCAYAWMPFALWGVEQANRQRHWRPLWKVTAGSALCFLAGYPPAWVALSIIVVVYSAALPWRARLSRLVIEALVLSLGLAAVQLFPAFEASRLKTPDVAYGAALPFGNEFYASLFLPNYFDQDPSSSSNGDYLYLGVPALFAILRLAWRRSIPGVGPSLVLAGVLLFLAADPTGLVLRTILHLPIVPDVLRRYNLVAGVIMAAALLTAVSVNDFLKWPANRDVPAWLPWLWAVLAATWSWLLLLQWPAGGKELATGFRSVIYVAVLLPVLALGLWVYRSRKQWSIAILLLFSIAVDYKVFGTSRPFYSAVGNADDPWITDSRLGGDSFIGLDTQPFAEIQRHPGYRVAVKDGPQPTDLRYYGIATPQGFDPFLPGQFKAAVERFQQFRTNRLFDINFLDSAMLQYFGVRWVMTRHESPAEELLLGHSRFRRIPPGTSYFVVFEYLDAQPAWRFRGQVRMTHWQPEHRAFRVSSREESQFVLAEQFFPGWHVEVDGKQAPNERAEGTFQSVLVPPGEHTVAFRYRPMSLYAGGAVSAISFMVFVMVLKRRR